MLREREGMIAAEAVQPLKIIDLPEFEPIEGRPNESSRHSKSGKELLLMFAMVCSAPSWSI